METTKLVEEFFETHPPEGVDADLASYDTQSEDEDIEKKFPELFERAKLANSNKLSEGGKRKNMPQATIDKFIHELLLIPDPTRRQEVVDEIFDAIKEKNTEVWAKAHPEVSAIPVATGLHESKLKEYGFIHNEAPRIVNEIKRLKREYNYTQKEAIDRISQEYGIEERTCKAIWDDHLERVRDQRKFKKGSGWNG